MSISENCLKNETFLVTMNENEFLANRLALIQYVCVCSVLAIGSKSELHKFWTFRIILRATLVVVIGEPSNASVLDGVSADDDEGWFDEQSFRAGQNVVTVWWRTIPLDIG